MALSINTNISSLTAQRAIADSKNDLETAMERLSTGSKINSASDDAAGRSGRPHCGAGEHVPLACPFGRGILWSTQLIVL